MLLRNFFTYSLILLSTTSFSSDINIVFNSPINKTGPSDLCTTEICKSLTQLINSSKESIDFAIYGLRGQSDILDALVNAKKRGVKVRGVIDKDISGNNYYLDTHLIERIFQNIKSDYNQDVRTSSRLKKYKKRKDKCVRPAGHKGPLQCFEGKGYASKDELFFEGDLMHNKFFIVDGKYIWTGSANISDTGTGGYNANVIALIESEFIASKYLIEFEQMFT